MLIIDLVRGKKPNEKDLYNELYDICDREHSCCNVSCPVYSIYGGVPAVDGQCPYYRNGPAMYSFIKYSTFKRGK